MWCRAQYHFSTTLPTRERKVLEEAREPTFPPHPGSVLLKKKMNLKAPPQRNIAAWICVLSDLRPAGGDHYVGLIRLLDRVVSRLSSTGSIERWFQQTALTENKQRARKITPTVLEAMLKLLLQDIGGVRLASAFCPRKLLIKPARSVSQTGAVIDWPMTEYAKTCQRLYAEFFGQQFAQYRSVQPVASGTQERVGQSKRKLFIGHAVGEKSVKVAKKQHAAAVEAAIAARESGKSLGPLGDLSDLCPLALPASSSTSGVLDKAETAPVASSIPAASSVLHLKDRTVSKQGLTTFRRACALGAATVGAV